MRGETHSASIFIGTVQIMELAIFILASTTQIALELDIEVELLVRCWGVLHNREPGSSVALTNAQVDRSIVAPWLAGSAPLAALFDGNTSRVDIVLRRGGLSCPLIVFAGVGAGERLRGTWGRIESNSFGFGT